MNTCDTCRYWGPFLGDPMDLPENDHKPCNHPKVDMPEGNTIDGLDSQADSDYGVTTGPKFGCVHHEPK